MKKDDSLCHVGWWLYCAYIKHYNGVVYRYLIIIINALLLNTTGWLYTSMIRCTFDVPIYMLLHMHKLPYFTICFNKIKKTTNIHIYKKKSLLIKVKVRLFVSMLSFHAKTTEWIWMIFYSNIACSSE